MGPSGCRGIEPRPVSYALFEAGRSSARCAGVRRWSGTLSIVLIREELTRFLPRCEASPARQSKAPAFHLHLLKVSGPGGPWVERFG